MLAISGNNESYEPVLGLDGYFKKLSECFPDQFSDLSENIDKSMRTAFDPYAWQNNNINRVQEDQREYFFKYLADEDVSCDSWLINFSRLYGKQLKPKSILDTSCKNGLLLNILASEGHPKLVNGIEPQEKLAKHAQKLSSPPIRVFNSDITEAINSIDSEYDLIISDPPLSVRSREVDLNYFSDKYNVSIVSRTALHIYFAAKLLSRNGKLLVPCSYSKLKSLRLDDENDTRGGGLRKILSGLGVSISACITPDVIPSDSWGHQVRLLILEKKDCDKIFLGRFKTDLKSQRQLIDNIFTNKISRKWFLGSFCEWGDYADIESVESGKKIKSISNRVGFNCVPGTDLFNGIEVNNEWNEDAQNLEFSGNLVHDENSIYANLQFDMETDLEKLKPEERWVLHLKVNSKYSSPMFLKQWFVNTTIGKETLRLLLEDPALIMPMDSEEVNSIVRVIANASFYLPDLAYQEKTLLCWSRLDSVQQQVNTLRDQIKYCTNMPSSTLSECALINIEDGYKEWIGSLPFPLASILWRHYASKESFRLRYKTLVHFFEALSAFMSTIHISAFVSQAELWPSVKEELTSNLGKHNLSFEKASFGAWRIIFEKLSGYIKRCYHSESNPKQLVNFFSDNYGTSDSDIVEMLLNSTSLRILQKANQIRNRWLGHSGALSEIQAKTIHDDLFDLVQSLRTVFKQTWLRYQLVEPIALTYRPGTYTVLAKRMMGIASSPFEEIEFSSDMPLCSGDLYLFDTTSRSGLRLQPLIKVAPSPNNNASACFIYNRLETDGVRMISYHFDQESEILSTEEHVNSAIESLLA